MCNTCNSKCTHGNRKTNCRDCGTKKVSDELCVKCKAKPVEVKKSGMCDTCNRKKCPHGKRNYRCVKYKGASICEHDRIQTNCGDCKGFNC